MCLQAKETPCTILYLIKGQKVDVGKGMIMDPSQRTFHNQPIPAGHFRVSLSSVKSGHEDLPPPVQHVGADDETPPRIGSCKGWVLLWPKNLIRLEPAESTPITTHQQACAETTTPPTQLPAPVVPGESGGRHDEGGAIVLADVISPVEQRMDDETEVDPMDFLNTNAYDCDIDMMSQPYDESGYQLANEDMDDMPGQEGRSRDCKKSLFMKSSQDTPEDAASTQAQLAGREGRTVLSPGTLGQGLRKGLEGVPKKKERKRSGKVTASKQARAHSSQTMHSEERVPVKGAVMFHLTGEPMLPPKPLEALSGDLRRLHDHVLSTEKSLLASKDPGYPTYAARVPEGKCYVDTRPAEVFFLRFDHIFEMFLTRRLDFTIVRLFALHMSSVMKREEVSQICVADPYYMHESFLSLGDFERETARDYLQNFMVQNKDREIVLVPYHPK